MVDEDEDEEESSEEQEPSEVVQDFPNPHMMPPPDMGQDLPNPYVIPPNEDGYLAPAHPQVLPPTRLPQEWLAL